MAVLRAATGHALQLKKEKQILCLPSCPVNKRSPCLSHAVLYSSIACKNTKYSWGSSRKYWCGLCLKYGPHTLAIVVMVVDFCS